VKLTDATIKSLKPRATRYDVYDDDLRCFGIRVTPNGVKTFTFFYRLAGNKKRRLSLGVYPSTTLSKAREKAHAHTGAVKGEHKHPEVPAEAAPPVAPRLTVDGLCKKYLESDRFTGTRPATQHQFRNIVKKEITPALGTRELATIAPADLADWTQGIIDRPAPVTANQSFKILRLIWNWGRKRLLREGIPVFPLAGFGKPWDGERPRKRHLSPEDMKKFVEGVQEEPRLTGVWWLLMLLNLTRKTETCLLEKSEIVWKSERGAYLIIPAEKAKNRQPLFQPLTRYTEKVLQLALKHTGESRWMMPGKGDEARFQRTGVPASRISRRIGVQVSPHDLRHTVATRMGELGVEPHVIDALQNHKLPRSTDVTGTYNDALVWAYFKQKREALELWHAHLDKKILAGRLMRYIRQVVDGKKHFEEAMDHNRRMGPHSEAHKRAMRARTEAAVRRKLLAARQASRAVSGRADADGDAREQPDAQLAHHG
jgi:integrase